MTVASISTILTVLKALMAVVLSAWVGIWVLRPTQLWKRSWHDAEDQASTTLLGDYGLNVVVFCFPLLAVAALAYIYLLSHSKEGKLRQRRLLVTYFSNPLIVSSPMGMITGGELVVTALFIVFLVWTYYSNVASDFKKLTSYKHLQLNRWQVKMMHMGVRMGSLSEACLVILLLPILRGMAVFRTLGVQFEASVRYHVWIANVMILLSVLHGFTIMFIWAIKKSLLNEIIKWQSTGRVNLAGAIALATAVIIWITSLPQIRRKQFQLFYLAHHLYIVFILFFLLHAGDMHFYLVLSGVTLFSLDKILRIIQSRRAACLISARILPCKAVELTLAKHPRMKYTPTSMIFVKIPSISKFQWHPFSIISSCNMDEDSLSVLIKCQGQWTNALHDLINSMADLGSGHMKCLSLAVEGPYGPATSLYERYDSLILIAGGSGITPFLSILEDIASRNGCINRCCRKIQLIYAVKRLHDLSMLTHISSLLLDWPAELGQLKLKIFVTQEGRSAITAGEILHDVIKEKTVIMDRSSSGDVIPIPEGLLWKATLTGLSFLVFLASLVCLSHIFIHQERKSPWKKNPSWVSDLLIVCSFVIAISCCAVVTVLSRWRKSMSNTQAAPQKYSKGVETLSVQVQGALEEHDIDFGKRPNLIDILSKLPCETREAEVGVFVCGPKSMQKSVATFCRMNSRKINRDNRTKQRSYSFHAINFCL